jgi:autotransporter-associated beta strand protein
MKKDSTLKKSLVRQQYLKAIAFVAGLLSAGASVNAATFTWDGGGGNGSWTTDANWVGDVEPDNDGTADIVMAGATRPTNRANSGWDINSLSFTGTTTAFNISGFSSDEILLGVGGIVNNDAFTHTINHTILVNGDQTWSAVAGGGLSMGRTIDTGGFALTTTGAGDITLGSAVIGSGSVTHIGTGTLTLNGVNTHSGGVNVSGGTVAFGNNAAGGAGSVTLNAGGTLAAAGGSRTIDNDVSLAGGALGGANNITFNGSLTGGGLNVTGTGTYTFNNANTFAGAIVGGANTIALGTDNALGVGNDFSMTGTTLDANNWDATFGALTLNGAGNTIDLVSDATAGVLTFASGGGLGSLTINGWTGVSDPNLDPTPGTDDRIFITADPGPAFLANITFSGYPSVGAARLGTGEIVPVPEPRVIAAAIGLLGFAAWRFVSRRRQSGASQAAS